MIGKNDYYRNTKVSTKTSGKVFKSMVRLNVWMKAEFKKMCDGSRMSSIC